MNPLDPYLFFEGDCAEAMRFYGEVLGGKPELMREDQAPGAKPPVPGKKPLILHARLPVQGGTLLASDWMADRPYEPKQGFYVSLSCASVAEARRVFDAFAEGGKVNLAFDKTFWSEGFGMVVDRFGTPWMVSGPQRVMKT